MSTDLTVPVDDDEITIEHEEAPASSRRQARRRHLASFWRPAGIFAVSRAATLLAAAIAADLSDKFGFGTILTGTWDAGWYLSLAEHGYPAAVPEVAGRAVSSTLGFFPLYPLAVRAVHAMGLSYATAGHVVTAVAGLAACVLLWKLVEHRSGQATADRAVALFCFFPGAMVLSLPYSEALMLALTIGCLYALLRDRWLTAGVLAALATAARPNAVALVAVCAWAAGAAVWRRRDWRALAAPLLAPAGIVAFFLYLGQHTGEVGAYLRTQREGWDQRLDPTSTLDVFSNFFRHPFADTNITVMVAGCLFLAVTLVLLVRARPPGILIVYTVAVMGTALLTPTMGARPRFLLTAFPLVTVLAEDTPAPVFSSVLATSATLLGAFTVLTMTSFLATP
jgi:hypothetical protein